jgi:CarD family transcriptional regulator
MYQVGDRVVYGVHGVCKIIDDTVSAVDRKKLRFLVLEPLDQPGSRFYVPTEKPAALAKLHPLLSKSELEQLLGSKEVRNGSWIVDENRRKQYYRELICSGDRVAILRMVRLLYQHKREQQEQGRKFHLCDENFMRDAKKLLETEFAAVLDIEPQLVADYVARALEK